MLVIIIVHIFVILRVKLEYRGTSVWILSDSWNNTKNDLLVPIRFYLINTSLKDKANNHCKGKYLMGHNLN